MPMEKLTDDEFAEAIEQAVDSIPDQFITALENIVLTMDDEPTDFQLDNVRKSHPDQIDPRYGEVLGLYEGVPITKRGGAYGNVFPDVITIFKGPHERIYRTRESMIEGIRKTVVHEIGHYYGMTDEQLHAMGY